MYYFIVNPSANGGHGEKVWRKLERRLLYLGIEYKALVTRAPGDAAMYAACLNEQEQKPLVIVAVGGDGTVNEVLNGLSFEGQVTIGYIPVGGGNDFARSLKLPRNPGKCLRRILDSRCHVWLDYGVLSYENTSPVHRRFAVSSGMGLDAAMCVDRLEFQKRTKKDQKGRRRFGIPGRLICAVLGIRPFFMTRPVKGYLILDGIRKVEFNHIYFISAHIHPYESGGFRFAPKADGSDGLLEVCVVHNSSRMGLIPVLVDAFLGKTASHRGVRFYCCREAQIHVEKPVPVHADGENCYVQTDIHVRCIEKNIRMLV